MCAHCLPTVCPAGPSASHSFRSEEGLNFGLLPILGELLADCQLELDRALLRGGAAASSRG
eukprot:2404245-Prymnesium_polylepis.1